MSRESKPTTDDMREEYDIRGGVRGKYHERYKSMTAQARNDASNETLAAKFAGKSPTTRAVYDFLMQSLSRLGPVQAEPKKTSIHLVNRTAFGGIQVRKNYLVLNLRTDRPLDSPRIKNHEQVSKNRFHQTVHLTSESDLDQELWGWLAEAYKLSG